MYLYLDSRGGFNDQLNRIEASIEYCVKTNRTLLIDTTKSCYNINFCDYFYLKNISIPIISDVKIIKNIVANESLTIYPDIFKSRDIGTWKFKFLSSHNCFGEAETNIIMGLPDIQCNKNIVVHVSCGNSKPVKLFKNLYFQQNIIDHVKQTFSKLPKKYICIQIRNTDRKCDYKGLYENNKELIHSYEGVYIATDDKITIDFFKDKKLNIFNFTTFSDVPSGNLHYAAIPTDIKIKNVICDIYIIAMAHTLLSNSVGGFIELVRNIRNDMSSINDKFN